jgi:hypothetical protein
MGDWSFDQGAWPDPKKMVDECKSYGIEIMVSVWPFSCPGSRSYDTLVKNNWITTYFDASGKRTSHGIETHGKGCYQVDPTSEGFRKYVWGLIETGYYQYGIKIFWLDASEPEGSAAFAQNASWQLGSMRDIGAMFQLYWTQTFYDGLRSHGETDIVMLPRAGWVGTWRHGAVLWSGDIGSTMEVLKGQVNIGLSAQMSGIPWWTTDVGGYKGGSSTDPSYREVISRWFQYGFTSPLFRQHGRRDHTAPWYYGSEAEKILTDLIKLRAEMKPYFSAQFDLLNETGRPFNRPLSWDFPEDQQAWTISEHGIGDTHNASGGGSFTPSKLVDGDFLALRDCYTNASAWSQQWQLEAETKNLKLTDPAAQGKCLDSGGGPYKLHLWTCSPSFDNVQEWAYDASKKAFSDPKLANKCLATKAGNMAVTTNCDPSTAEQQWEFDAAKGGPIKSHDGKCLTVIQDNGGGGAGVQLGADQFMMGDDFMAAPVLNLGQRARAVYFPKGADWVHHYTSTKYSGGTTAVVDAPLSTFPLFKRA